MDYTVVRERNPETGVWVAEIPGIAGCYSQGNTRDEALANVKDALELVLELEGPPKHYQVEIDQVRLEG